MVPGQIADADADGEAHHSRHDADDPVLGSLPEFFCFCFKGDRNRLEAYRTFFCVFRQTFTTMLTVHLNSSILFNQTHHSTLYAVYNRHILLPQYYMPRKNQHFEKYRSHNYDNSTGLLSQKQYVL